MPTETPPYATQDEALEYYPGAEDEPEIRLISILEDASDYVNALAPIRTEPDTLSDALTDEADQVPVTDLSLYPPKGVVQIDDERITYTSKSDEEGGGLLLGAERGTYATFAEEHDEGAAIFMTTQAYAKKRVRCELRLFEYLFETGGIVASESLSKVASTRYAPEWHIRRIVRRIMGPTKSAPVRISRTQT